MTMMKGRLEECYTNGVQASQWGHINTKEHYLKHGFLFRSDD